MISNQELLDNMTADEKFDIICRMKSIDKDKMIESIIDEIKELYDYAQDEYIGEFTTDSDYCDGEVFGGYTLYLDVIATETYQGAKESHLAEYGEERIGDFDVMDFDSEYLDLNDELMNFVKLGLECGLKSLKYWCDYPIL